MSETENRYWIIDYATEGEPNRICDASTATGMPLVGIVDELAGGVIAYALAELADDICAAMNARAES